MAPSSPPIAGREPLIVKIYIHKLPIHQRPKTNLTFCNLNRMPSSVGLLHRAQRAQARRWLLDLRRRVHRL